MKKKSPALPLAISIILCETAGAISIAVSAPVISTWYAALTKPPFNLPASAFGLIWATLSLLMGISLFLVWQKGSRHKEIRSALILFAVQFALTVLWPIIFFALQNLIFAFVSTLILWTAVALTITDFYKISKSAAWLLLPYLLWISFAIYLNYAIIILN